MESSTQPPRYQRLQHVQLAGVVTCLPERCVHNRDYPWPQPEQGEQFIRSTGIAQRWLVGSGQTAADLCLPAAQQLLAQLDWSPQEVGLLVFVSQTPDYRTPATSMVLHHLLGLPPQAQAYDLNLGCSGYSAGLMHTAALMQSLGIGRALLLVGDVSSVCTSAQDRSTAPLFSDAGSATALVHTAPEDARPNQQPATWWVGQEQDGAAWRTIHIPGGGARWPSSAETLSWREPEPGQRRTAEDLVLNGLDVYAWALRRAPSHIQGVLETADWPLDTVDYALFHQANLVINRALAAKLKLPSERTPSTLAHYGNTSSATLPVTLVACLGSKLQEKPHRLLLCGFGVGMAVATVLGDFPPLAVVEQIHLPADVFPAKPQ